MKTTTLSLALALSLVLVAPVSGAPIRSTVTGTLLSVAIIDATMFTTDAAGNPDTVFSVTHRLAVLMITTDSGEIARVLVRGPDLLGQVADLRLGAPLTIRVLWGETAHRGTVPVDTDFLALRFLE